MPSLNDFDPNKDETQGGFGSNGSSGSSSGGGQLFGGASKQVEQQYTPWSRFTSANSDVANQAAGQLQKQVAGDVNSAQGALNGANNAYNAGIQSQYAGVPGTNQRSAGMQQATNTPPVDGGGGVNGTAFGSWGAFGKPPAGPIATAGAPAGETTPGKNHSSGGWRPPGSPPPPPPAPPTSWGDSNLAASGFNASDLPAPPSPTPTPSGPRTAPNVTSLTRPPQANAQTVANGPQGPKDLESSMSPDAWAGLTSKVNTANSEASALGNESGIGALLAQNSGQPMSAADKSFNAALVNGAGQQGFQQYADKFGNNVLPNQQQASEQASQDAWSKLGANVDDQKAVAKLAADNAATEAFAASQNDGTPGSRQYGGVTIDQSHLSPDQQKQITDAAAPYLAKTGNFKDKSGLIGALQNDSPNSRNQIPQHDHDSLKSMLDQLGISNSELIGDVQKMSEAEYDMFITLGVIPKWMNVGNGPNGKPPQKGVARGWSGFVSDDTTADSSGGAGDIQGQINNKTLGDVAKVWLEMLSFA